jgi:hypothetical protein
MKNKRLSIHLTSVLSLIVPAALLLVVAAASPALAHGGKEHGAADFTSFKALEKATGLYNRLLSSGKLDASWETGLDNVTIATPTHSGGKEFVVTFHRTQGEPQAVYFFFSAEGKYAGSNFTGP